MSSRSRRRQSLHGFVYTAGLAQAGCIGGRRQPIYASLALRLTIRIADRRGVGRLGILARPSAVTPHTARHGRPIGGILGRDGRKVIHGWTATVVLNSYLPLLAYVKRGTRGFAHARLRATSCVSSAVVFADARIRELLGRKARSMSQCRAATRPLLPL